MSDATRFKTALDNYRRAQGTPLESHAYAYLRDVVDDLKNRKVRP